MTKLQMLYLLKGAAQLVFGSAVAMKGYAMMRRRYDRTQGEYLAGMILVVLGFIVILLLGVR